MKARLLLSPLNIFLVTLDDGHTYRVEIDGTPIVDDVLTIYIRSEPSGQEIRYREGIVKKVVGIDGGQQFPVRLGDGVHDL